MKSAVKANPDKFKDEFLGITRAVSDRVQREERELYPLVDAEQKAGKS